MVPPDPVKVTLLPLQIVNEGDTAMVGEGTAFTVTVCVELPEQPFVVPVNV